MQPPSQLPQLESIFSNVVSIAIGLAGVLLFIMLLVGGFKYLSAGADAKAAEGAKGAITWAIYGIVILALAYFIMRLIAQFTGVNEILNFQIINP